MRLKFLGYINSGKIVTVKDKGSFGDGGGHS